jgi:hypothetical protein
MNKDLYINTPQIIRVMKAKKAETSTNTEHCWQYSNCPPETRKNCFLYLFELSDNCWKYSNVKNKNCQCNNLASESVQKQNNCDICKFYQLKNKL